MVEAPTTTARYMACVNRLQLPGQVIISVHSPLQMTDSFPQPDIAVLRWRSNFYEDCYPTAAAVQLLIEVEDSTTRYDRHTKGTLYAREAIADYWLTSVRVKEYRSG